MIRQLVLFLVLLPLLAVASPSVSHAQSDLARRVESLIAGLDYGPARQILADADPDDPALAVERARLAIYELDCDGAAAILSRPEVQKTEAGEQLADIARGCQRVTAALAVDRDEKRGIELRWQDEHDRALAPLVFDTVAAARETLSRELGVDWPLPTRIVIVRDLLSLSAMTGLPYKSAQTTGTVAVAKWGRVTLLSPRASPHGYQWRDTIAHELTHLAVTRASGDRAPLWLQEGVAKREEIRWRPNGPFDDRPTPEAIVARGTELNLGIPLDKLGPSIAMLPSADAAMVAFAEVTSFVRYYARTEGDDALPKLLAALKDGEASSVKDLTDAALVSASGADLQAWDTRWRGYVSSRPAESIPALFGLGGEKADGAKLRDLRDRSRLAELLLARNHAPEAMKELDRIELAGAPTAPEAWERAMGDPSVVWLRARALEATGRRAEAEPLVADPARLLSSYAPWWATRGRFARLRGDEPMAGDAFWQAVAGDPFDPEGACETVDASAAPTDPLKASLCSAAREWIGAESFGSE
jgi:hypothetical protein